MTQELPDHRSDGSLIDPVMREHYGREKSIPRTHQVVIRQYRQLICNLNDQEVAELFAAQPHERLAILQKQKKARANTGYGIGEFSEGILQIASVTPS